MKSINIRPIDSKDDLAISRIVRDNLKKHHLDIPGTAYYDPELDHLSLFYSKDPQNRGYFVVETENGEIVGGIGMAKFDGFAHCGEIQKLYVSEQYQRQGIGQRLLNHIESHARHCGIHRLYLETHSNLKAAIILYEKNGYHKIERPESVVHSTMDLFYIKDLLF